MLVSQRSLFTCPPIKFSSMQYGKTNQISLFHNYHATRKTSRVSHALDLKCSMMKSNDAKDTYAKVGGIGILEFFEGKNIFVIGGTGFLGKAYVNGREEGLILEKPLIMGEMNAARNNKAYPELDIADEISIILKSSTASSSLYETSKILKKLGQQRAEKFGWNNTYQLTKAMGEMVMEEKRGDIPLLILRPTVVGSSYQHPFPGWIQGKCRMFDPFFVTYGKGYLPAYLANPIEVLDMIPVDMVANATIAAIAKHGNTHEPQVNVYHVGSSVTNPLRFCDIYEYLHEYFNENPLVSEGQDIPRIKFFDNFNDFSKYTRDQILLRINKRVRDSDDEEIVRRIKTECKAKVAYAEQLCKMYEFAGFFNARFDIDNIQKLKEEMSKEEQLDFEVDARNIDWKKFFTEIHVPGLRKYIIN